MSALTRALRAVPVDTGALRESPAFRVLFVGQLISTVGRQVTTVAVPYQVYQLTHSAFAVGVLGLVQVVPLICVALVAGALADRVDRRRLLLVTQLLLGGCSLLLAVGAARGNPPLLALYVIVGLAAAVSAIDQPTRTAVVPNLVSAERLGGALSLNVALFTASMVAGPALGGLVLARFGLTAAYLIDVGTFSAALLAVALLPAQPPRGTTSESQLRAIARGLSFVRRQPAILGGFVMDLGAMIFGLPRAVFPVLAATVFRSGPTGLGLLYAATGAGALLASLATGWVGHVRSQGRIIVVAVAVWGLAITAFGLVGSLPVALLLLAVAGAADGYSAVCRNTMMQTLTPDELRGRLSAVYFMVVVGGPFLGDLEAGSVASLFSPRVAVVSGGLLSLVALAGASLVFPQVLGYRAARLGQPPLTAAADGIGSGSL
ncbi:MAG: MFS transporter [Candidatus Dormibacteria bacterium]